MVMASAGTKHDDAAIEAKEDAQRHREFAEIHPPERLRNAS
jgi:hypothetical protein